MGRKRIALFVSASDYSAFDQAGDPPWLDSEAINGALASAKFLQSLADRLSFDVISVVCRQELEHWLAPEPYRVDQVLSNGGEQPGVIFNLSAASSLRLRFSKTVDLLSLGFDYVGELFDSTPKPRMLFGCQWPNAGQAGSLGPGGHVTACALRQVLRARCHVPSGRMSH